MKKIFSVFLIGFFLSQGVCFSAPSNVSRSSLLIPNGATATTQSQGDNSTKVATTAYVDTGLGTKAPTASPTLTGTVTVNANISQDGSQVVSQGITNGLDSYTKLLAHFDGANAAVAFTDSTGKAATFQGDAKLSTTQTKFGTTSLALDGTGDYITFADTDDFDFSGGVWTVDFWINPVAWGASDYYLWSHRTGSSDYIAFYYDGGLGALRLIVISGGSTVVDVRGTASTPSTGVWSHVEVVENGDTYKLFVNGADVTASGGTDTDRPANYTGNFLIGGLNTTARTNAYFDEFRISNGIARHTAAFTVPTAPYKTIETNRLIASSLVTGTTKWTLGSYTTTAPSATGYVTITIDGVTYKLLASNS